MIMKEDQKLLIELHCSDKNERFPKDDKKLKFCNANCFSSSKYKMIPYEIHLKLIETNNLECFICRYRERFSDILLS